MIKAAAVLASLIMMSGSSAVRAAEAANPAHALAQKFAESTASKRAAPPSADYEADMLRRAEEERAAGHATDKSAAPPQLTPVIATTPATAAEPPARLSNAPAAPAAPKVADTPPANEHVEAKAEVPPPQRPVPLTTPDNEKRVTLMLAIEMGGSSKMAEMFQGLDPVLCAGDVCYISSGIEEDAVRLSRKDALKLKSSEEASQNSCRGMAGCIYRNVGLPAGAALKLVALGSGFRIESHALPGAIDATCEMSEDGLVCENPVATTDFRIWVVPEAVAKSAGIEAIEDAVAAGLPQEDVARTTDK